MKYLKVLFFTSLFVSIPALSESPKNISLNFTDTQTQKVLKIIADFSNKGIILPSSELGLTSIHIKDIPWSVALEGIAKSKHLQIEVTDNLIVVSKKECGNKKT